MDGIVSKYVEYILKRYTSSKSDELENSWTEFSLWREDVCSCEAFGMKRIFRCVHRINCSTLFAKMQIIRSVPRVCRHNFLLQKTIWELFVEFFVGFLEFWIGNMRVDLRCCD